MLVPGEILNFGDLRIVKAHVDGRKYRAVVIDYAKPKEAMKRKRETGKMYPQVFWARTVGWTKEARQECRDWILQREPA